jgi:hypothetical protein
MHGWFSLGEIFSEILVAIFVKLGDFTSTQTQEHGRLETTETIPDYSNSDVWSHWASLIQGKWDGFPLSFPAPTFATCLHKHLGLSP